MRNPCVCPKLVPIFLESLDPRLSLGTESDRIQVPERPRFRHFPPDLLFFGSLGGELAKCRFPACALSSHQFFSKVQTLHYRSGLIQTECTCRQDPVLGYSLFKPKNTMKSRVSKNKSTLEHLVHCIRSRQSRL